MVTVIFDQFSGCISANKDRIKRFVARIQPFVEYHSLEQRSRETFEKEARIGFARPEPLAEDREQQLVWHGGAAREDRGGLLAVRSATRNLLLHESRRRDVLN